MSKAQYDIYVDKVKSLAKTLVVKSQATAAALNTWVDLQSQTRRRPDLAVNPANPLSWKYYLNVSGQYHWTDTEMTVISLDTLQTIDFTKDALLEHTATAREYAYGSRYYNELLSRYPTQELLIRGILNPIAIATVVEAADATILWSNPILVEENEENLITGLQSWINRYMVRWNVVDYAIPDELYVASQLGVMYLNLPLVILNLRLANCHTRFAHSYHILEFLASHGRLDTYADNLTKKQMLWLYRNIAYLQRNAGKQETFDLLLKNILTDRGLPLAAWNMRHNLHSMPEALYPEIEFTREPLNYGFATAGVDTRSVAQLLSVETLLAKGNPRVEETAHAAITVAMENSPVDRLETKILESAILDLTDASIFTLSDCLLNHWLYLAQIGQYKTVLTVDNPHTGGTYTFNARDAFIVYLYAYNKARGFELGVIPTLQAMHVRRQPVPTLTELRGIVNRRLVNDALLNQTYANLAPVGTYISTASFHNGMLAVHKSVLAHRFLYATQEHFVTRGLVEECTQRFYQDFTCDLANGQTYASWFNERGLDITTLTDLEADLLAIQILSVATGTDLKVAQSLKDMQGAMLRLMAQLSSYSIQFLQSINAETIRVIDAPVIRVGDDHAELQDAFPIDALNVRVLDLQARSRSSATASLVDGPNDVTVHARMLHQIPGVFELDVTMLDNLVMHERVWTRGIRVLSVIEPESQLGPDTPLTTLDEYQAIQAPLQN